MCTHGWRGSWIYVGWVGVGLGFGGSPKASRDIGTSVRQVQVQVTVRLWKDQSDPNSFKVLDFVVLGNLLLLAVSKPRRRLGLRLLL